MHKDSTLILFANAEPRVPVKVHTLKERRKGDEKQYKTSLLVNTKHKRPISNNTQGSTTLHNTLLKPFTTISIHRT